MSAADIGKRLKKARLDAGLTQKEVAIKLGITYQAISNYERGINRVDTDTLTSLCKIYGIQIFDLLRAPAWDSEMFEAYEQAENETERKRLIELCGCPAELIEEENERREPSTQANPHSKNTIRIAGRDGSYREETLSDKELAALIAFLDLLPDVPEGL